MRGTQRWVRMNTQRENPSFNSIFRWYDYFVEHGKLVHRVDNGRPRTSAETVTQVRAIFENQPRLSISKLLILWRYLRRQYTVFWRTAYFCTHTSSKIFMASWMVTKLSDFNLLNTTKSPWRISEYLAKIFFPTNDLSPQSTGKMWEYGTQDALPKVMDRLWTVPALWYGAWCRNRRLWTPISSKMRMFTVKTTRTC